MVFTAVPDVINLDYREAKNRLQQAPPGCFFAGDDRGFVTDLFVKYFRQYAKGGVAMIGVRTGATIIPVFVDGEKKFLRRTRVIFGKPYIPSYSGRHGTAEEMQKIADEILTAAYALGGQAVGGVPL